MREVGGREKRRKIGRQSRWGGESRRKREGKKKGVNGGWVRQEGEQGRRGEREGKRGVAREKGKEKNREKGREKNYKLVFFSGDRMSESIITLAWDSVFF